MDDDLINFSSLIGQVLTDSFFQQLPVTFKAISSIDITDKSSDHKKRKKEDSEKKNRKIINSKKIDEWIVSSPKEYQEKFAGKNLSDRPKLFGKSMCQRFHSKGYCFFDCYNKETHIPSQDLDEPTKKDYWKYCQICTK